jgi:hypothetical protein
MSGSTSFEWNGNAVVEKVQLAGSFTQWKPVEMEKNSAADEKWALKLDLSPGEYEFKFVVDGNWVHDELLPTKPNEEGSKNNVIKVEGESLFQFFLAMPSNQDQITYLPTGSLTLKCPKVNGSEGWKDQ